MPTAFEQWEAGQSRSAKKPELTAFEKWELEQERLKKEQANAAKAAAAPTPVAASTGITSEERARRIAEGIPLDPVLPDNPMADAVMPVNRIQNVIPQGLSSYILQPAVQLGGMAVDALRAPHAAWIAAREGKPYQPQVSGTLEAAELADAIKLQTDEQFPKPRATVELERDLQDDKGFMDSLASYRRNPIGAMQKGAEALIGAAPVTRVAGVLGGAGLMGGGSAAVGAAPEFDEEARKGIVQQSPEYAILADQYGPEEALRILKAQRMTNTAVMAGAAAAGTAGLTSKYGLNPLDRRLAGLNPTTSAASMPIREAIGEVPEEVATQFGTNVAAIGTGSNRSLGEGLPQSAAGAMVLGAAAAAPIAGVDFARKKLADAGALADGAPLRGTDGTKKPDAFVPDPKINEALAKQAAEKAAKEGVGATGLRPAEQGSATVGGGVVPPTTPNEPVRAPTQPQVASTTTPTITPKAIKKAQGQAATLLATDTTFAAEVQANPLSLKDRVAAFARIEQEKLDKAAAKKAATEAAKVAAAQVAQDTANQATAVAPVVTTPTATVTEPVLGNQSSVNVALSAPPKEQLSVTNSASPIVPTNRTRPTVTANEASNSVPVVKDNLNPAAGTAILSTEAPPVKKGKKGKVQPVQQPVTTQVEGVSAPVTVPTPVVEAPATTLPATPVEAPVQPSTQPQVAPKPAPTLPKELAGAKPRYSYGAKGFELEFANDVDKAAYIAAQPKPSKSDQAYVQFVMDNTGMTEEQVRARGQSVRAGIKTQARDAKPLEDGKYAPLRIEGSNAVDAMAVPTGARAVQPVPAKTGDSGRDVVTRVALGGVQGSETQRLTAAAVKNSPNLTNTKVVVVQPGPEPNTIALPDGTVVKGTASYSTDKDTIYIREDAGSEEILHEANHATTTKAISDVKQGRDTTPERVDALADLEDSLAAIQKIDVTGLDPAIAKRIKYAGNNVFELTAILQSAPGVARALDKMRATVTTKRTEKGTQYVPPVRGKIRTVLDNIVDALYKLINKPVKDRGTYKEVTREVIRERLLTDIVSGATSTFQKVDTRKTPFKDIEQGYRAIKGETQTNTSPAQDAMAVPVANPADVPKSLKAIPRGLKGKVDKFVPELLKLFSHTLGASRPVSDMVREAHGMRNFKDWQVENLLSDTTSAMKKSFGKRASMYDEELVKALTGKPNNLPPAVRDSVQQARTLIDQLSIKLIAIGAVSPRKLASVIKRLGSYVHADYKAWKMGPGEWQSLQESPRGDGSNNATDLIMSVLPEMMADIALPPDAQLDALAAAAKGTDKKAKVAAKKELDIMLGRYGYTKDKDSLAKKIAFLKKTRDNFTPESFKEFAAELARKLMNPKGIVIDASMPFKPFSVDSTGMRKKTAVPAWQKKLWGEYEEYDAIVINTVRMLGGMLDKWTAMQGYKQQLIDEGILVENSVPIGYTKLSDPDPMVYGPLNGYAIRDQDLELVDALAKQGIQGVSALLSGLSVGGYAGDALAKGSSMTKVMAIVLAPDAWVFNAASTVMMGTLASGHPLAIAQHGKRAADFATREAFAGMGRTTKLVETDIQEVFEILFKEGVLGDSALAQDLRSDLAERVIDEAYKNAPTAKRMWHQTKATAKGTADIGGRGLAVGDTAGKILSVYARIPYLRNIYPNKDFKELLTIAAKETANSLPSMSRSIPLAKAIARQGMVMPFAGYFAETFRNTVNDIGLGFKYQIQGLKAMKAGDTKEGAAAFLYGSMIHAGNLARHSLVWSFRSGIAASIYGLYQLAVTAFDDDGDDEEDDAKKQAVSAQIEAARKVQQDPEAYKAIRELLPDYFTGDAVLLREVEPGVFAYTTTQRLDMYTTGSALTAYERTGKWEDAAKAMFEPFLTQSLIARPVVDMLKGREGAEWDLAAALFVPGPVKRADRIVKAEAKGYEMTAFEKSMHMGGMSVAFVDVKQELANKMQGLASGMNDQMKSVSNSLDPNRTDVSERYLDTNDFQSEFVEAVRKQGQAFKEFQPILKAADKMGISSGDVIATAKLNGVTLAKKDLAGLLMGKFIPPRAAQIVTNKWKTELKAASQNPRQVSRINAYYTRVLEDAELIDEAVSAMLVSEGVETLQ